MAFGPPVKAGVVEVADDPVQVVAVRREPDDKALLSQDYLQETAYCRLIVHHQDARTASRRVAG